MPIEAVRPNSNINSGWGAGNTHLTVDDAVTSPSAGSGDFLTLTDFNHGAAQQWGCNTPSNAGTIASATIRMYVRFDNNSDGYISSARIRLNGTWYTASLSGAPGGGSWGWMTATASGSYGAMATSAPAVELTFYATTPDSTADIDTVYLDLDYNASPIERYAVANGNSNSTATWNGGTLPTADDDVYANGYTVTVNASTSWKTVRTTAGSVAVAGGGFTLSNGVTLTLTGSGVNVIAGSSHCLTNAAGASVTVIGNLQGSQTTSNCYGFNNAANSTVTIIGDVFGGTQTTACGVLTNAGTVNVTGNVTAGSGSTAEGVRVQNAAGVLNLTGNSTGASSGSGTSGIRLTAGTATVNGNVIGGVPTASYGLFSQGTGTITINGNSIGGSGNYTSGVGLSATTGTVIVNGNAIGGSNSLAYGARNTNTGTMIINGTAISATAPGVEGASISTTRVRSIEVGSSCIAPLEGKVEFDNLLTATGIVRNSALTQETLTAGPLKSVFAPPSIFGGSA